MSISDHIKSTLTMPTAVINGYLADMSDDDLMMRPHENANHIAWQLGHLISAEHDLNNMVCPDSMPDLPEGFYDKHSKEKAASDNKADFCTKEEYVSAMQTQREGTLALLDRLSDQELEQPGPEKLKQFADTVGGVIAGQATHWMMHAGQWVVVRRKLGKGPLF
jgi:hypothetical protein